MVVFEESNETMKAEVFSEVGLGNASDTFDTGCRGLGTGSAGQDWLRTDKLKAGQGRDNNR